MFSASGRFPSPALVNNLLEVCFAARCSEQLCLAGCFLSFSLILLSVNAGLFCWVRLGSRWHRAQVDWRAAEVMKSCAVFTHHLAIRPSFFPLGGGGDAPIVSHKHAHKKKMKDADGARLKKFVWTAAKRTALGAG